MDIKLQPDGAGYRIEPPLLTDGKGRSLVRKVMIEVGVIGGPTRVVVELLPHSVLAEIKDVQLILTVEGGRKVKSLRFDDGSEIRFPTSLK